MVRQEDGGNGRFDPHKLECEPDAALCRVVEYFPNRLTQVSNFGSWQSNRHKLAVQLESEAIQNSRKLKLDFLEFISHPRDFGLCSRAVVCFRACSLQLAIRIQSSRSALTRVDFRRGYRRVSPIMRVNNHELSIDGRCCSKSECSGAKITAELAVYENIKESVCGIH
ncbi:hypothetical protein NQZ79_g2248 [Umbelopsis isabellina]|nr:hypothetical protein NQZ79_g2248 [Umbelopsis isabellina]